MSTNIHDIDRMRGGLAFHPEPSLTIVVFRAERFFSNPPTLQGLGSSGTRNTTERIPLGSFYGNTLREAAPERRTLQNEFPLGHFTGNPPRSCPGMRNTT